MVKRNLKASVAPVTTHDAQADADKARSVAALAKWRENQAKENATKASQEKASKAAVDANMKENQQSEDSETNAILAQAVEIGEELSSHPEFIEAMRTAIQAKEDDEYKSVACLKWMEKFLSPQQLSRLPMPGSTKAEAEAEAAKLPADKKPNMLIYDKVIASGGRKGTDSFYKHLVRSLPTGKDAFSIKEQIEKENAEAIGGKEVRPDRIRKADEERANRAINQQLSALRIAARVYLQIQKVKKLKNLEFEWIRDEYQGDEAVPETYDPTQLVIPGMADVVHSPKVIWMHNKHTKSSDPHRFSIGQFIRFRISDDMIKRGMATITGDAGLIASAKKKPDGGAGGTPIVPKSARAVNSWTDLVENTNEVVRYYTEDNTKATARYAELHGSIGVTTDTLKSMYRWFKLLEGALTPNLIAKAKEEIEKEGK